MHRLAGSDTGFLLVESPTQGSTCVDVLVLDPPRPDQSPLTREQLVDHLSARLPEVPHLRRRLRQVPLGLAHPVLVDDPHCRPADHVDHVRVAAPGDERALHELVADQLSRRLDRTRPLWRVTLVDGFPHGSQALVFAFHHALADGAGLVATLQRLVDDRSRPTTPSPGPSSELPAQPRRVGAGNPHLLLLVVSLLHQLRALLALPLLAVRTWRGLRAVDRRRAGAPAPVPPSVGGAPQSVLNRSADATRDVALATVPLADVQRLRDAAGCTLSDVLLAVVAGGLRTHLTDRLELPAEPLVANVPVARAEEAAGTRCLGNRFANHYTYLPTDEPDPRRRLAAVAAARAEARHQLDLLGADTLAGWLDRVPPGVTGRAARRVAERQRDPDAPRDFNLLVSNMRVPHGTWTMRGRTVRRFVMTGPVADGAGLNVTVTGYADRLTFALVVNPSAVPAPVELANRLVEELAELLRAHGCVPSGHEVA